MVKKVHSIAVLSIILSLCFLHPAAAASFSYTATVNIVIKRVYYLHRTALTTVTPAGELMNTTRPPSGQSETTLAIARGDPAYFYTPQLSSRSVANGMWVLYVWASTVSSGSVSRLDVGIHVVSSDGSTVKATIGTITGVVINYGYSERTITISGSAATIGSGDRIRLTLYAETGGGNDNRGMRFYYDGYGAYETLYHETRLQLP
jgi:hypothetical protein